MGKDDDARDAWRHITTLFFGEEVHNRFHDACAEVGLPHPGALKLLLNLEPGDSPSMRELAGLMRCDASYVTALVDVLEDASYVERRVSPTDRRVKLACLTDAGSKAKEQALDVLATPPKALGRLSAADTKALARLLGRLADG